MVIGLNEQLFHMIMSLSKICDIYHVFIAIKFACKMLNISIMCINEFVNRQSRNGNAT